MLQDKIVQTYKRANFPAKTVAFIADRFRILLLRDYGGVFCDVDAKVGAAQRRDL